MKFEMCFPPNFLKIKNTDVMIDIGSLEDCEFEIWLKEYTEVIIKNYNKRKIQLRNSQIV
jgi:hypothetical protein